MDIEVVKNNTWTKWKKHYLAQVKLLQKLFTLRSLYQSKRQAKKNYIFTKPTLKTDSGVKLGAGILTKDYTWDKQKRERETERENILSSLFQNPLTQTLTTVDHFPDS